MGSVLCGWRKKGEHGEEEGGHQMDDALDVEELMQEAEGAGTGGSVELSISCTDLPDRDKFSRSDPFVVCTSYLRDDPDTRTLLGRTETKENCLNPVFLAAIICSYSQTHSPDNIMLHFECYHERSDELLVEDQVFMGEWTGCLAEMLASEGSTVEAALENKRVLMNGHHGNVGQAFDKAAALATGTFSLATSTFTLLTKGTNKTTTVPRIQITAEYVHNVQEKVIIELSGKNLEIPKTRFGLQSAVAHYYMLISRVQGSKIMPIATTSISRQFINQETIRKGLNPTWQSLHIKTYRLCNNNFHCPLLFQLFDHNFFDSSKSTLIGQCRTSLAALTSGVIKSLPLIDEKKTLRKKYVSSGELLIKNVQLLTSYSFLDYVKRGFEINCTLAIDFSASCADMHRLHEDTIEHPNDFSSAIRSICEVVGRYDKDQMFPCYGFSAMLGDAKTYQHFPISLDLNKEEIQGQDEIVNTYERCVQLVRPVEPSHLAPTLHRVLADTLEGVEENPDQPGYQLMILFTDGIIDDMTETIDVIVEASTAPMSVLIVGMGNGGKDPNDPDSRGFGKIRDLCSDKLRSVVTGKSAKREIVSFVSWNDFKEKKPQQFARAALARVPKHFLSWVEMSGYSLETMKDVSAGDLKRGPTFHVFHDSFAVPDDDKDAKAAAAKVAAANERLRRGIETSSDGGSHSVDEALTSFTFPAPGGDAPGGDTEPLLNVQPKKSALRSKPVLATRNEDLFDDTVRSVDSGDTGMTRRTSTQSDLPAPAPAASAGKSYENPPALKRVASPPASAPLGDNGSVSAGASAASATSVQTPTPTHYLNGVKVEVGGAFLLQNLADNPEFNGEAVKVVGFAEEKIIVDVVGVPDSRAAVRPEFLRPAPPDSTATPPQRPLGVSTTGNGNGRRPVVNPYGPAASHGRGLRSLQQPQGAPSPPRRNRAPMPPRATNLSATNSASTAGYDIQDGGFSSVTGSVDGIASPRLPGLTRSKRPPMPPSPRPLSPPTAGGQRVDPTQLAPGTVVSPRGLGPPHARLNTRRGTVSEVLPTMMVVVDFGYGVGMKTVPASSLFTVDMPEVQSPSNLAKVSSPLLGPTASLEV